ncbi:unnamed protein product [Symbiodinium natans]|uniref:Uncharacterized protein n=1 Tax=Symbiodinium natans TaxID=878477 RepID=A0A812GP12_9DINO|nr:unnamed protein product [Symbiodinium natans]
MAVAAEESPLLKAQQDVEKAMGEDAFVGSLRRRVQRLFGAEHNPKFAENAEHAFRGAFALVFFAIPIIMPRGVWAFRDDVMELGVYSSGVCMFIVFNLGTSFGQAFNSCKSGLQGTLLSSMMGWLMYTLYPEGYQSTSPDSVFYGGVLVGVLYVTVVMYLRFGISLQMFALSGWATTWMNFLNDKHEDTIMPPWTPGWTIHKDILTQGFICTGLGMVAVVIASLLPYPRWSLMFVTESQLGANLQVVQVLETMVKYYSQDKPNVYVKDQVIRRMTRMRDMVEENDTLLAAAWWECWGLGRSQVKRRVLASMDKVTKAISDLIWNAWQESISEDVGEMDAELMRLVRPSIEKVLKSMQVTMNLLVKAASDGNLDPAEVVALKKSFKDLEEKDQEMCKHFTKVRKEVTKGEPMAIYKEVRVAQVLLFSVSRVVAQTIELADKIQQQMSLKDLLPAAPELGGCSALFANLLEKDHVIFAARGLLAYLLAFQIGWHGWMGVVPKRAAGIAGTTPYLLTMYVGSALVSDLNRMQGLMIGQVMARVVRGMVDSCHWDDLIGLAVITFTWVFLGVFVREHSSTFSSVGSMAAAFGATTLLATNCSNPDLEKEATFDHLAMNCVAVLLTTVVNLALPADSASKLASQALDECWGVIRNAMEELYDPKVKMVKFHAPKARALLKKADALGDEAGFEPRLWKTPWQSALFDRVTEETSNMVATLSAIETSIAEGGVEGAQKCEHVRLLTERSTLFNKGGNTINKKLDIVRRLLGIFAHETQQKFPVLQDPEVFHTFRGEELLAEQEFIKRLGQSWDSSHWSEKS